MRGTASIVNSKRTAFVIGHREGFAFNGKNSGS